jgi:putative sigma-54 modulation protein
MIWQRTQSSTRENIVDKMLLDIWCNQEMSDALREYIDRKLRWALDRYDHRLDRIQVRLEDVNGPRGGVDKRCRVQVIGRPSWRIHVEGAGATFYDAIDAAAARARRSVGQLLSRLAEQRKRAVA